MREYFIWLLKLITVLVLVFFVVPVLVLAFLISSKQAFQGVVPGSELASGTKHVAVVEVTGLITSSKDVLDQLYAQVAKSDVLGIVLKVDSPGGAIAPSQDIFETVKTLKARKPIVASMGSLAASGGLYVSLGASKIYAEPGTMTGSIGVIMQIPNFSKLANYVGVDVVTIKSGQLKDVGNSFREMTPEERQFLETTVHSAHAQFISAVSEGRQIPRETVETFADGRVLLGSDAKKLGLIDEFGSLYDAAREVYKLTGQPLGAEDEPQIEYVGEKYKELRRFLDSVSSLPGIFSRNVELRYQMAH